VQFIHFYHNYFCHRAKISVAIILLVAVFDSCINYFAKSLFYFDAVFTAIVDPPSDFSSAMLTSYTQILSLLTPVCFCRLYLSSHYQILKTEAYAMHAVWCRVIFAESLQWSQTLSTSFQYQRSVSPILSPSSPDISMTGHSLIGIFYPYTWWAQ